jgi:predicted DNA-binding protein (MmcQ/YjbR family)
MIDSKFVRSLALSFPDTTEEPHFEKASFRYKKKIFATLASEKQRLVLKLSPTDQSVFIDYDETIFSPATGAWGKKGWTIVEMKRVRKDMARDAMKLAYQAISLKGS